MNTARIFITIGQDQTPGIFRKQAEDGATAILITAKDFQEATHLYFTAMVEELPE